MFRNGTKIILPTLLLYSIASAQMPTVVRTIGPAYHTMQEVGRDSIVVSMWPALHASWPAPGMFSLTQYFPLNRWPYEPPKSADWGGNIRIQIQRYNGFLNDSLRIAILGVDSEGFIVQNTVQYPFGSASTYVSVGDTTYGLSSPGKVYNNPNVISGLFDPFKALLLDITSNDLTSAAADTDAVGTRWKITAEVW